MKISGARRRLRRTNAKSSALATPSTEKRPECVRASEHELPSNFELLNSAGPASIGSGVRELCPPLELVSPELAPAAPKPDAPKADGMMSGVLPDAARKPEEKMLPTTPWGRYAKVLLSSAEFVFVE